jgi:GrpB-like predicted nucleotidyltransferase (UPF0157 family)
MIGLRKNTVEVLSYQEKWSDIFEETKNELHELLKKEVISIEHIGSTAIKEMPSKPIIDIAVAIENYNKFNKIRQILSLNNYEDRGEKRGGYLFIKSEGELITHHIHFVLGSSKKWREYLSFKNKLNSDNQLRKEYSKLKQILAKSFVANREEYTISKSKFIDKVLRLIEKERT